MPGQPTVFLVDDDPDMRAIVAALVRAAGLGRVEVFVSAEAFLAQSALDRPGCLLLEARLPDMCGLQLQATLAARGVPLPVIMVMGHADVRTAVAALRGGAYDFLEKPVPADVLRDRIRAALACDARRRQEQARHQDGHRRLAQLTQREREVLGRVVLGHDSQEIAAALGVRVKAIEAHRSHILQKMGVRSAADLVRLACLTGFCPLEEGVHPGPP
jgi:two-component system, LuxR family, response regulator FixJ